MVTDRHRLTLRLAGDVGGEVDERSFGRPQDFRSSGERLFERRTAAVHSHLVRGAAVAEPRDAQRAGVARCGDAILFHDEGDVVARAPAAEAGDVLDGPLSRAHAIRRSRAVPAVIWRYTASARRTSAA